MTANLSKSGGISIEISGDAAKLQAELKRSRALAVTAGKDISTALRNALTPKDVGRGANSLANYLATAARAAQGTKNDLSGMDSALRKIDQTAGAHEYLADPACFAGTFANVTYADGLKLPKLPTPSLPEMETQTSARPEPTEEEKKEKTEENRRKEARATLNIGGMLQTGIAEESQKGITNFWEKALPQSIGKGTDTIGAAFAAIGLRTKSVSQAFADMGKSIQGIFQQIVTDFISMSLRTAVFGHNGSGGLLGGLVSGIGSALGGLFGGGVAVTPNANGGVFSAPDLAAYTNTIVSKPTLFPFAKGIGLMGEAGAEAIMPLRRGSGGRLGVDASGIGNQAPQFNVIVNTPPGVGVKEQGQKSNGQGGVDLTLFLEMVDTAVAAGISSGRSRTAQAMNMRGL